MKNELIKNAIVLVEYTDGSSKLMKCSLEDNLSFTLSEMKKWIENKEKHNLLNLKKVSIIKDNAYILNSLEGRK